MRSSLLLASFAAVAIAAVVACSSDSTGTTSGASTDGGTSSSGGGSAETCYLKKDLLKCECTKEKADEAHPTSDWSTVLNCSNDTLDNAAHCSGESAPCSCDVLHCEIITGQFCGCGTRTWAELQPGAELAELTTCTSFEFCCESTDGSECYCEKDATSCKGGFTATATPSCSVNDRKVPAGKTATCGE